MLLTFIIDDINFETLFVFHLILTTTTLTCRKSGLLISPASPGASSLTNYHDNKLSSQNRGATKNSIYCDCDNTVPKTISLALNPQSSLRKTKNANGPHGCLLVIEFCIRMLTKLPTGCHGRNKTEGNASSGITGWLVLMVVSAKAMVD